MQRASCLTCNAKSSSNSPWKIELAELNEAIKKSCDEEQVWEAADEVVTETESLNLIADQERVFLVGIQVKSERPEGDTFTGMLPQFPMYYCSVRLASGLYFHQLSPMPCICYENDVHCDKQLLDAGLNCCS